MSRLSYFVMSCIRDPRASPELTAKFRAAQYRATIDQLGLSGAASIFLLCVALFYFRELGALEFKLSICAIHVSLLAFNIGLWWYWRGRPGQQLVSRRMVWALTINVALGAFYGPFWQPIYSLLETRSKELRRLPL